MSHAAHLTYRLCLVLAAATLACGATMGVLVAPSRAASSPPRQPIPVIEVSVDSTHITAPTVLSPGFTTFHTTSSHPGTDSLAVVQLDRGVSYAQIFGYLRRGDLAAVFRHVSGEGGIAHGGPHNGHRWTTNLHRGQHLLVDDEAKLFAELRVTGQRHRAPRPRSSGTIRFHDGTFTLPRPMHDGSWRIHNDDTIQHEIGLLRIGAGHTRAQVERVLAAGTHPSWLQPQATVNLIGPHRDAWVRLRRLEGFYVFLDYLPMFQTFASGPVAKFAHIHS